MKIKREYFISKEKMAANPYWVVRERRVEGGVITSPFVVGCKTEKEAQNFIKRMEG